MSEFSEGQWQRTIPLLRGGLALYSPHISLSCVNSLGKLSFSSGEPHHHHHHPLQVTWANPVVWAIERPSVAGRVAQSQLEKLFCLQIGQHLPEKVSPELSAEIHFGVDWELDSSSNHHYFLGTKRNTWTSRCWTGSGCQSTATNCQFLQLCLPIDCWVCQYGDKYFDVCWWNPVYGVDGLQQLSTPLTLPLLRCCTNFLQSLSIVPKWRKWAYGNLRQCFSNSQNGKWNLGISAMSEINISGIFLKLMQSILLFLLLSAPALIVVTVWGVSTPGIFAIVSKVFKQ